MSNTMIVILGIVFFIATSCIFYFIGKLLTWVVYEMRYLNSGNISERIDKSTIQISTIALIFGILGYTLIFQALLMFMFK